MRATRGAALPALTLEQRDALSQVERPLRAIGRPDTLTAQRVEVAIVLHAMLGDDAASEYLNRYQVASHVTQRILSPDGRRRGCHDAHGVRIADC